jgi:hypothetical protein
MLEGQETWRWLACLLRQDPLAVFESPERALVLGEASFEQLETLKRASKSLHRRPGADAEVRAFLGYVLSVASAAAHYRARLSHLPAAEVETLLLDLAGILPEPWSDLLARAAMVLQGR